MSSYGYVPYGLDGPSNPDGPDDRLPHSSPGPAPSAGTSPADRENQQRQSHAAPGTTPQERVPPAGGGRHRAHPASSGGYGVVAAPGPSAVARAPGEQTGIGTSHPERSRSGVHDGRGEYGNHGNHDGYGTVPGPMATTSMPQSSAGRTPKMPGPGGYGTVLPSPPSNAVGAGGPGRGGPGGYEPPESPGEHPGDPADGDLEWWEHLTSRLMASRLLKVLRRIQAIAVWACLPIVVAAALLSSTLRASLGAWLGCMWVVMAWFWMARTKTVSWGLVSRVFAISIPWAGAIGWLSLRIVDTAGVGIDSAAAQMVVAGIVEELCKLAPLVVLALLAPGRVRRLLVCDWLLLGVASGAGFMATEEMLRRIVFLSEETPGTTLARAMCLGNQGGLLKCLGATTFGPSPFSGSLPMAGISYGGHAVVTGLVAACFGLARHMWWRGSGRGAPRSGPVSGPAGTRGGAGALGIVGRILAPLVGLTGLWVAIADHMARNATTKAGAWSRTGGEAPWPPVGATSVLTGGGNGRGWLLLTLLAVGAVLDARVLRAGGYDVGLLDDLGATEGRAGGGALGALRGRLLAGLFRSGPGRWVADGVDALLLPLLEWRLVVRAAGAGRALRRFNLPIRTVTGLRAEREAAARAVMDPGRRGRWATRVLALSVAAAAVIVLVQVPDFARGLDRSLAPRPWGWLAGILDSLGSIWESMSPAEQLLAMATAGALVVLSGGTLGLAFGIGTGLMALGSAHGAAQFVRDPRGSAADYLTSHTPGELIIDGAAVAMIIVPGGGLGRGLGKAARETRRWERTARTAEDATRSARRTHAPRRAPNAPTANHAAYAANTAAQRTGGPLWGPRAGMHYPGLRMPRPGRSDGGPGVWGPGKNYGSPRAQLYEEQVTGVPIDHSYYVNDVEFDGYDGFALVDAKGEGYSTFIKAQWSPEPDGDHGLVATAERQVAAVRSTGTDTPVQWQIAEKDTFDALWEMQADDLFPTDIELIHTPPKTPPAHMTATGRTQP